MAGVMQIAFAFPSSLTITSIDAERHPELQQWSTGSSELVQLTLWLMIERRKGDRSSWYPFLQALPVRRPSLLLPLILHVLQERTRTPILWSDEELQEWCRGSSIEEEAAARRRQLLGEWDRLREAEGSEILQSFDEDAFLAAFSVVLSNAFYVPSAARFALLPPLTGIQRTGDARSCTLDYDPETDGVTLTAQRDYRSLCFAPISRQALFGSVQGIVCACSMAGRIRSCCWRRGPSNETTHRTAWHWSLSWCLPIVCTLLSDRSSRPWDFARARRFSFTRNAFPHSFSHS